MGAMSLDKDGTYLVLDYDKGPGTIMVKHIPSNDFFMVTFHDLRNNYDNIEDVHRIIEFMLRIAGGREDFLDDLGEALQPYKVGEDAND